LHAEVDRLETRTALAIDGGARDFDRQACEQPNHAAYIQALLAGLVGAAPDEVFDFGGIERRCAFEQTFDAGDAEFIAAHVLEVGLIASGAPDWSPDGVYNYDFTHV
jgi:hypothetical protein